MLASHTTYYWSYATGAAGPESCAVIYLMCTTVGALRVRSGRCVSGSAYGLLGSVTCHSRSLFPSVIHPHIRNKLVMQCSAAARLLGLCIGLS